MNPNYINKYLIKPAEDGSREDTKLAVEFSDEQIAEFVENGYLVVGDDDFQKLIGNADKEYCIAMDGSLYEKPPYVQPLEEVQQAKIDALKATRDALEVEPIEYNGNTFDYDDKARDRINAAIIALEQLGESASLEWTTVDNKDATVTAQTLKNIISAVAVRSNQLHVKYRELKEKVLACTTNEEVATITWETA
ncbi:DUF4376 domain-containing protein [Phascolarctobacterium sp.]|uniref:DUF4376 domain-containing protein n=1 Tax=Phascolarctobacterium sp. TaxID=2049039 RepID=UPI003868E46F